MISNCSGEQWGWELFRERKTHFKNHFINQRMTLLFVGHGFGRVCLQFVFYSFLVISRWNIVTLSSAPHVWGSIVNLWLHSLQETKINTTSLGQNRACWQVMDFTLDLPSFTIQNYRSPYKREILKFIITFCMLAEG